MIVPAQLRMARAALGLSVKALSRLAQVADSTILRFETNKGGMQMATLQRVQDALEQGGVIFIARDDGGGPGVRLRV